MVVALLAALLLAACVAAPAPAPAEGTPGTPSATAVKPYPAPASPTAAQPPAGPYPPPAPTEFAGPSATPLPTATPVPTWAVPPTLTPPFLQAWPTPTPTPLPEPAERGRQFVAAREGIPVERLTLNQFAFVTHPATGAELWVGSFMDLQDGRSYRVLVDAQNQAAYPPDFAQQALVYIAAREHVPVEHLTVTTEGFGIYPFTRRFLWYGKIMRATNGDVYGVALDLALQPVDEAAALGAEESTRQIRCRKVDSGLCQEFLTADPDRRWNVNIYLSDGANDSAVTERIVQAGYTFERDHGMIVAALSGPLILDLGGLGDVAQITLQPGGIFPLNSTLLFVFEEATGEFTLKLRTAKEYGCLMPIAATLARPGPGQIAVTIDGIDGRGACPAAIGPARLDIPLGQLDGVYELTFVSGALQDRYRLTLTAGSLVIEPLAAAFTWAPYQAWLRLPAYTVWFVTSPCEYNAQMTPQPLDRARYQVTVDALFAAVEQRGAVRLELAEGPYTQKDFMIPWPSWWGTRGEYTVIPILGRDDARHELRWPVVRYYEYRGSRTELQAVVEEYAPPVLCAGFGGSQWPNP
jgi:hypothetical protein